MTPSPDAYVAAREDEIRDAAFRVFVRKGIEPARMQDIADEAGLSAGALYRYFDSKDDLIRSVFESCEHENRALFAGAPAVTDSPLGAILASGRAAWSWFDDEDARDRFLLHLDSTLAGARERAGLGAEPAAHSVEVIGQLEELVRAAQAAGELPEDLDARALAVALLAMHQGLGVLLVGLPAIGHDLDTPAVLEVLNRMLYALSREGGTADVAP